MAQAAKAAKAAKSGRTTSLPGFRDPENMRTQILPLVLKFLAPKTEEDERAIHGTSLCDAMTSLAKAYTSDENSGKEGAERAEQDDLFWRSVAEALDFIMPHSTADAQSIRTYRDLVMYYCGRLTEASTTAKLSPLTELLRAWQKKVFDAVIRADANLEFAPLVRSCISAWARVLHNFFSPNTHASGNPLAMQRSKKEMKIVAIFMSQLVYSHSESLWIDFHAVVWNVLPDGRIGAHGESFESYMLHEMLERETSLKLEGKRVEERKSIRYTLSRLVPTHVVGRMLHDVVFHKSSFFRGRRAYMSEPPPEWTTARDDIREFTRETILPVFQSMRAFDNDMYASTCNSFFDLVAYDIHSWDEIRRTDEDFNTNLSQSGLYNSLIFHEKVVMHTLKTSGMSMVTSNQVGIEDKHEFVLERTRVDELITRLLTSDFALPMDRIVAIVYSIPWVKGLENAATSIFDQHNEVA